jgi:hypothetical protein
MTSIYLATSYPTSGFHNDDTQHCIVSGGVDKHVSLFNWKTKISSIGLIYRHLSRYFQCIHNVDRFVVSCIDGNVHVLSVSEQNTLVFAYASGHSVLGRRMQYGHWTGINAYQSGQIPQPCDSLIRIRLFTPSILMGLSKL